MVSFGSVGGSIGSPPPLPLQHAWLFKSEISSYGVEKHPTISVEATRITQAHSPVFNVNFKIHPFCHFGFAYKRMMAIINTC